MWKLSESSLKNREGIDDRLIKICDRALELSTLDFGIPKYGGLRTYDEQKKLHEDEKSKCDGKIYRSQHQFGLAIDFFAYSDAVASWDERHMTCVACAFLQSASEMRYPVVWGGHWFEPDMPHIEIWCRQERPRFLLSRDLWR